MVFSRLFVWLCRVVSVLVVRVVVLRMYSLLSCVLDVIVVVLMLMSVLVLVSSGV